jgi:hypothetical protein
VATNYVLLADGPANFPTSIEKLILHQLISALLKFSSAARNCVSLIPKMMTIMERAIKRRIVPDPIRHFS